MICGKSYQRYSLLTPCCSELGLSGSTGMSGGSPGGSQFQSQGSLYGSGLAMGSLQSLARTGRPGPPGGGGGGGGSSGSGGLAGLGVGVGLQGRITPTQFGTRSMGGLGQGMSLLQASSNSRNPLFSRKMGWVERCLVLSLTCVVAGTVWARVRTPSTPASSPAWARAVEGAGWQGGPTTVSWDELSLVILT